ncbi:MAG: FprA family A-type flavoprotein [Firmicutes bacterium]|nr:FprA family A-type flavoprotein [Bacillota bacterium]
MNKITDSVIYIGANDHDIDLFEGHFEVPLGMSYNSYIIMDEKIAVMDTIDRHKTDEWLANLKEALAGRTPDYLIIHHMEPDHSASIAAFLAAYPNATVVGNKKTFNMISQFFPGLAIANKLEMENGGTLSLGTHELTFIFAPMVHWPEVMMSYDSADKILFSADAFGKFGALDVEDPEGWACEARRYYFGIVGKYGAQVQAVLKKAADLDIKTICPLHGPVLGTNLGENLDTNLDGTLSGDLGANLDKNLDYYLNLYNIWSSYEPESKGVCILYTSVYGNTKEAAELLAEELRARGVPKVAISDLARDDIHECIEDAFRYDKLVLATTTYNADVFPFMREFIEMLRERSYQKRTVALIENGSWAPMAIKAMKAKLESLKEITFTENNVTILSALTDENRAQLAALADELAAGY